MFRKIRTYSAALSVFLMNLGILGISVKGICSPGFNCHGCPWATGACPIGIFAFGSAIRRLPLLALSSILLLGIALGRLVCGFFCPFGFLQDLLAKLPLPKFRLPGFLRWCKYAVLLLLVFLLPFLIGFSQNGYLRVGEAGIDKNSPGEIEVLVTVENISEKTVRNPEIKVSYLEKETQKELFFATRSFKGVSVAPEDAVELPSFSVPNHLVNADLFVTSPQSAVSQDISYDMYFCKFCPAGALTASVPSKFGASSGNAYAGAGWFSLKFIILYVFIGLMLFSNRPFCRILCPLGALYGICSGLSVMTVNVDKNKCISCRACDKVCPVELDVVNEAGGPECIACGDCIRECPVSCIQRGFRLKGPPREARESKPEKDATASIAN